MCSMTGCAGEEQVQLETQETVGENKALEESETVETNQAIQESNVVETGKTAEGKAYYGALWKRENIQIE